LSQKNVSVGITAFLDILGFGNRVLSAQSIQDIDDIAKDVKRIQKNFDYKSEDSSVRELQKHYKKTVLAFSDSVIVNVPLQSRMTEMQGTFDAVMSELSSIAFAQAQCVNSGLFLRGGVDIGWWYRRGATLASQSMVRAYKTEGQANVPVIALTDDLYDFLAKNIGRKNYSADYDPFPRLFRKYSASGAKGKVSFWYLDYIDVFAESIDWITSKSQHQQYRAASADERDRIMEAGYTRNREIWFTHHARTIEAAHAVAAPKSRKNTDGLLRTTTRSLNAGRQ
jgi:hypothetical protein